MLLKSLLFIPLCCFLLSCETSFYPNKIEGKRIEINQTIADDSKIEAFIAPYRNHVNQDLDSILSYAPLTYSKRDGELNTSIGNLMADAVFEQSNPLFLKRSSQPIDFVLLNYGGIRANISAGPVTSRTAYEIMPFENTVVVVKLKGIEVQNLLNYLAKNKRAHPISKHLKIVLDSTYKIKSVHIGGEQFDPTKSYYVATNDYLYNGGSDMTFLKNAEEFHDLNYKVRNTLIDYFKQQDTLKAKIDLRFTKD
jgi:2',3'-cyclic-nucleotide 2'-phosphodiesterase (5'-nucleotidase family)